MNYLKCMHVRFSAYPLITLHQIQSTKRDRGAGVSTILRTYKCCTRMLIFTRKRNLNITVSTERNTIADITENPEEVRKEEEGETEEERDLGTRASLVLWLPGLVYLHSSWRNAPQWCLWVIIQYYENKQTRKLPLRLTAFHLQSAFKAFV